MDNKQIARILRETAQLLEIDGAIIGRYRSYEKAAELIDALPQPVEQLVETPEKLLELPGIGQGMVEHLTEIVKTGDYALRKKLLKKYPETLLDLLSLQSLGPKKVALLWKTFKAATVGDVEKIAREGKLRDLAGFGEKSEQNILKAVEVFKKSTGRFLISRGEEAAEAIAAHIKKVGKLVESVTPAGSLRRGKETVGDLDLLVTMGEGSGEWRVASGGKKANLMGGGKRVGKTQDPPSKDEGGAPGMKASATWKNSEKNPLGHLKVAATGKNEEKAAKGRLEAGSTRQEMVDAVAKHILTYPGIDQVLAHGENKVSFTLEDGLQVDVRLLEKENFGAALLYFTGSKEHNVTLRGRANDMGYTLNEYELATLGGEESGEWRVASGEKKAGMKTGGKGAGKTQDPPSKNEGGAPAKSRLEAGATKGGRRVAGRTEEEIYGKLKLDYIPPELRENTGEIEAAEKHTLPKLVELKDIKGDLQMHTPASDGKNTIEEMAAAAKALGHEYIAITDHSKAVTVANGLDEKRMAEHIKRLRAADAKGLGIRVLVGSEVDILKDGELDYSDEILAQLDVVVCSIHSYFNLSRSEMTERMLAAVENPYTQIIGHPTGRLLLRREALDYDVEKVLDACAKHGVAMECNSYPDRLDLKDVYLRMCKEKGVKVVISTDSHNTGNLAFIRYGVTMARRGWLEKKDVINTLPVKEFLGELREKPGEKKKVARR
jgi:DNA polymerase/3'-5' exonuclease PolX/histidinol phosphatase-like PHP family hydrolase